DLEIAKIRKLPANDQTRGMEIVKRNRVKFLEIFREKDYPEIVALEGQNRQLTASLSDGRLVSIPAVWFKKLREATDEQLNNFEILPDGYGVTWSQLDEDISYSRLYMRKLRATKKGLTSKTPELNPVKPINVKPQVKPEPCPHCRTLAEDQQAYENLQHQIEAAKEKQREQ
ncbi:14855_t:CDS:2, partial [Racocetra persica]